MVYETTSSYIYKITAERFKNRMKQLDKNYYQIMGYESEIDYGEGSAIYDYEMVYKIVNGIRNKNNLYLLSQTYAELFKVTMKFTNFHELYWGTDDEIKSYNENLFYCMIEDMQNDNATEFNVNGLLSLMSQEEIYHYISENFIKEFIAFTHGVLPNYDEIKIADNKKKIETKSQNKILIISDTDFLTFKKLNKNIERFAQGRLYNILTLLLATAM